MNTAERLIGYGVNFDEDIILAVERVTADQDQYPRYGEFLSGNEIPQPEIFTPDIGSSVQSLHLKPAEDYDEKHARVLYLPMGSGLTPNKIVRAATLFLADPSEQLVVIGNPGIPLRDGYSKV